MSRLQWAEPYAWNKNIQIWFHLSHLLPSHTEQPLHLLAGQLSLAAISSLTLVALHWRKENLIDWIEDRANSIYYLFSRCVQLKYWESLYRGFSLFTMRESTTIKWIKSLNVKDSLKMALNHCSLLWEKNNHWRKISTFTTVYLLHQISGWK